MEVNETNFICNCTQGHTGIHCEQIINYCNNVTCLNKGICRPLLLGYKCECLSGSEGHHCEQVATSIIIRQAVAKSFAYIAIIAMSTVAGFVIVLDILKYVFGIDVTRKERDEIRREQNLHKKINRETTVKPRKTFRLRRMNKITPLSQLQKPTRQP